MSPDIVCHDTFRQAMKKVQQDLSTLNEEMETADISLAAQTRTLRLSIEGK